MKRLVLAIALFLAPPASAGFDDGVAAYRRGDLATAVAAFEAEAEAGFAAARFTLGYMHQFGQGVARDDAEAARWYGLAADQGHAGAQYNLGVLYQDGRGVERDDVRAYVWLDLAASGGAAFAAASRDALARSMSADEIAEAERRVREWRARKQSP